MDGEANVPTSWAVANGYYIRNNANEFRALYGMNKLDLQRSFDIDATTLSLYLQSKFETEVAGRALNGEIGALHGHRHRLHFLSGKRAWNSAKYYCWRE